MKIPTSTTLRTRSLEERKKDVVELTVDKERKSLLPSRSFGNDDDGGSHIVAGNEEGIDFL